MKKSDETTTSAGMGSTPNNARGWMNSYFPKGNFPYDQETELNEEEEVEKRLVFEPVKFYHLSKHAKKFLLSSDSTGMRNILHAAAGLQVPLHNLVSTFFTPSLSVLEVAEEVMTNGNYVKIINTGAEWWNVLIDYKGINFMAFTNVYGNPLPDPNVPVELCITVKASDFEMLPLAFPNLEFTLNED